MAEQMTTPVNEFISAVCVLGIVVSGMLIMLGAITVEEIRERLGGCLVVLIGGFIALYLLKIFIACVAVPWLVALKSALFWLAIIVLAIIAFALIVNLATTSTDWIHIYKFHFL